MPQPVAPPFNRRLLSGCLVLLITLGGTAAWWLLFSKQRPARSEWLSMPGGGEKFRIIGISAGTLDPVSTSKFPPSWSHQNIVQRQGWTMSKIAPWLPPLPFFLQWTESCRAVGMMKPENVVLEFAGEKVPPQREYIWNAIWPDGTEEPLGEHTPVYNRLMMSGQFSHTAKTLKLKAQNCTLPDRTAVFEVPNPFLGTTLPISGEPAPLTLTVNGLTLHIHSFAKQKRPEGTHELMLTYTTEFPEMPSILWHLNEGTCLLYDEHSQGPHYHRHRSWEWDEGKSIGTLKIEYLEFGEYAHCRFQLEDAAKEPRTSPGIFDFEIKVTPEKK